MATSTSSQSQSQVDPDILEKVKKAKLEKKIFIVIGRYEMIRHSLKSRGWLEKIPDSEIQFLNRHSEKFAIALLLKQTPFKFIWQSRRRPFSIDEKSKPYVNSIIRQQPLDFTSKDGIVNCVMKFGWNYIEGLTDLNYQRTFVLNSYDYKSKEEFSEEFRKTAFTSFILYLNSVDDFSQLFSINGDMSTDCIKFSILKIELLLKAKNHEDIDTSRIFDVSARFPKNQKKYLDDIGLIMNNKRKFKLADDKVIEKYQREIRKCANEMLIHWPYLKFDGYKNIWILKPLGSSSGYGIQLTNNESEILSLIAGRSTQYVAQKYIERPLIIHNRKFDMRIYLLTMIRNGSINIWLYKDCYVKFSTYEFNLNNFNKSIHVTNYAVQKFFMNKDKEVPGARENMWTLKQLIEYFKSIGKDDVWQTQIYPGIKKNLLAIIIPSFEDIELKENNFELNGVDVMITYDYTPTIIEINSVPALFFSPTVQELITDRLLDDVVKVVIDHSDDSNAFTGDFELIYSQEIPSVNNQVDLTIIGKRMNTRVQATGRELKNFSMKDDYKIDETYVKLKTINPLYDNTNQYVYYKQV